MCFAGERRSGRTSTTRIVFYLFGFIGGFRPSLRWLRLSGRRPSFAGTVPCAITPPPNRFESVYGLCSVRTMTFTIHASKNGQSVVTVRISPAVAVDKARVLETVGWRPA
jgi:hypothetical protein